MLPNKLSVVAIEGCIDVLSQVLVVEVHTVVNQGDVDAFARDALCPDRFDVYVLTALISQVPLAPVKGVPNLRVVQRICLCLAVFQECGIIGVLESVDGIGHRVRPDSEELEDPDVVSAGAEVVSNEETVGPTIGVCRNDPVSDIDRLPKDPLSLYAPYVEIQMRTCGQVQPEVVLVASKVY